MQICTKTEMHRRYLVYMSVAMTAMQVALNGHCEVADRSPHCGLRPETRPCLVSKTLCGRIIIEMKADFVGFNDHLGTSSSDTIGSRPGTI